MEKVYCKNNGMDEITRGKKICNVIVSREGYAIDSKNFHSPIVLLNSCSINHIASVLQLRYLFCFYLNYRMSIVVCCPIDAIEE